MGQQVIPAAVSPEFCLDLVSGPDTIVSEVDPMLSDDSETFSMRGFIVGEDELPEVD